MQNHLGMTDEWEMQLALGDINGKNEKLPDITGLFNQ